MHARAAIGAIEGVLFVGVDGSDVQTKKNKLIDKCVDLITQSSTMITKK
jgi:hypothetical protein